MLPHFNTLPDESAYEPTYAALFDMTLKDKNGSIIHSDYVFRYDLEICYESYSELVLRCWLNTDINNKVIEVPYQDIDTMNVKHETRYGKLYEEHNVKIEKLISKKIFGDYDGDMVRYVDYKFQVKVI